MLFNRPKITRQLFEKIRQVRPTKLFVAANGPRPGVSADIELCNAVRKIFDEIDWECDIHTNFPETNINMHIRWYATLDWFFENVDSGIILEDDCIPDLSFFPYCTELLEKYKNDERIMHVNGSNFQFGNKRGNVSYYFSKYPHVWGWATWKRAWQKYDYRMSSFPEFEKKNMIDVVFADKKEKKFWKNFFKKAYLGIFKTADVRWAYAIWMNNGLCIAPNVNMISNIGYGSSAGHTVFKDKIMCQETHDIGSLVHPKDIIQDKEADEYTFKTYYYKNFFQKVFYMFASKILKTLKP
jgi:hypothetical protein